MTQTLGFEAWWGELNRELKEIGRGPAQRLDALERLPGRQHADCGGDADHDQHDVSVIYQTSTDLAVCVRETEDGEDIWLPLSQIETAGDEERGEIVTITGPEWLFEDKGLI